MEELTSILVINSIQIANAKDDDPTKPQLVNLVKFHNYIPPIYLKIYQSYQLNDINQFFKLLYVDHLNNPDGLINQDVLKQLLLKITYKRLNYLQSKFINLSDEKLQLKFNWILQNRKLLENIGLTFDDDLDLDIDDQRGHNSDYSTVDLGLVNKKLNELVTYKTDCAKFNAVGKKAPRSTNRVGKSRA
ncbi:unnamed protein product [Ambrosiozyma monospora]|uniref:Unnamed protein product n=1 Tax=Ambrosiozyma monospora TaxID=43982 RepID=A0A9W7DJN5_AMBMO|nr:unnamed protein product [Ambrosiozyma monospora]